MANSTHDCTLVNSFVSFVVLCFFLCWKKKTFHFLVSCCCWLCFHFDSLAISSKHLRGRREPNDDWLKLAKITIHFWAFIGGTFKNYSKNKIASLKNWTSFLFYLLRNKFGRSDAVASYILFRNVIKTLCVLPFKQKCEENRFNRPKAGQVTLARIQLKLCFNRGQNEGESIPNIHLLDQPKKIFVEEENARKTIDSIAKGERMKDGQQFMVNDSQGNPNKFNRNAKWLCGQQVIKSVHKK